MHELYELKEMLCEELKKYGEKSDMSTGSLEVVDKLAHTVKNLGKIIEMYEMEEDGYSGYYPMYYGNDGMGGSYENRGGSYNGGSYEGGSYARGGRGGNRGSYARGRRGNVRRDAMGRYSRASEDVKEQLREIMEEAPDNMKSDILKLINKM